jgi:hypothetical protein
MMIEFLPSSGATILKSHDKQFLPYTAPRSMVIPMRSNSLTRRWETKQTEALRN